MRHSGAILSQDRHGLDVSRAIEVPVRDTERSARFYRTVFGLDHSAEDDSGCVHLTPCDATLIDDALVLQPSSSPQPRTIRLVLPTSAAVNRAYVRAARIGAALEFPRMEAGQWFTAIMDPDQHRLELRTSRASAK